MKVIERIAKFGIGEGHAFYAKAARIPDYASEAVGLDI